MRCTHQHIGCIFGLLLKDKKHVYAHSIICNKSLVKLKTQGKQGLYGNACHRNTPRRLAASKMHKMIKNNELFAFDTAKRRLPAPPQPQSNKQVSYRYALRFQNGLT